MSRLLIGSFSIGVLVLAQSLFGWTPPVNISGLPSGSRAFGPRAAVDGNNLVHLVYPGGLDPAANWRLNYRFYNGSAWSSNLVLGSPGVGGCDIAVDGANNLHVVWHGDANPEEVYYIKRTGSTWGAAVNLSGTAGRSLFPRITVNSAGTVILVAWHESGQVGGEFDVLARKFSGGAWGTIANLSADNTLSRNPNVVMDAAGNIYVCWEDVGTSHSYYRRHTAAGAWEGRIQIDNSTNRAFGPDMWITPNGALHFAWHDDSAGNWELYYRNRSGTTWSGIHNVSLEPALTDAGADIRADSNGNLRMVWHDYDDIWYSYWSGGGWAPKSKVFDATSQNSPVIVLQRNNNEHCFWQRNNGTNWNIMWSWQTPPVPPAIYQASLVSFSAPSVMRVGTTATIIATFTNTGNQPWNAMTRLAATNPRDRASVFYNSADWLAAHRPTAVDANTAVGADGVFTFIAKAPMTPGTYTESFELVQDLVTWFNGPGDNVNWTVTVTPPAGTIAGTVRDVYGNAISGATVATTVGGYAAGTNSSGQFAINNVPVGTYNVTASKTNYQAQTVANVSVVNNATSTANFNLTPLVPVYKATLQWHNAPAQVMANDVFSVTVAYRNDGLYNWNGNTRLGTSNPRDRASAFYNSADWIGSNRPTAADGSTAPGTVGTFTFIARAPGAAGTYTESFELVQEGVAWFPDAGDNVTFTIQVNPRTLTNGDMEGGFFDTGWGGGSRLPNGWSWFNPGDFNAYEESSIRHGGARSVRTRYTAAGGDGGAKRGICQAITVTPNAGFTLRAWARHTNGNCPSIMAWNPGTNCDPHAAYLAGRYKWLTTDNWGQLNTWVYNTLSGTAPADGAITIILGGTHWGGGGEGNVYIDDVQITVP